MIRKWSVNLTLEDVLEAIILKPTQSPDRLRALADYVVARLGEYGLPGARGGSGGELKVRGLARVKDWDVAYEFAGKFRLLISLKSMWKNAEGTVPNRLDDHMGEIANVQQLSPEIVIGYIVLFDVTADKLRKDGITWSEFFERAIRRIAIRKAPLWNQGLLEGSWFVRFDSRQPKGARIVDPRRLEQEERDFFRSLLSELHRREPAIPFQADRLEELLKET
jgi:hypothetical protein